MKRVLFIAIFGIMSMGFSANKATILNEKNFDQNVSSGLVLVDFYADWCGPCRKMGPVIDRLADELEGDVAVYKVNVSKSKGLHKEFHIRGIPTIILFKDGQEVGRMSGARDRQTIKKFIADKANANSNR